MQMNMIGRKDQVLAALSLVRAWRARIDHEAEESVVDRPWAKAAKINRLGNDFFGFIILLLSIQWVLDHSVIELIQVEKYRPYDSHTYDNSIKLHTATPSTWKKSNC